MDDYKPFEPMEMLLQCGHYFNGQKPPVYAGGLFKWLPVTRLCSWCQSPQQVIF